MNSPLTYCVLFLISDVANWQRANVWSLIQDNEYVLSKLHASLDVFPTLMGTCGGLYVVEALEPLVRMSCKFQVYRYVQKYLYPIK